MKVSFFTRKAIPFFIGGNMERTVYSKTKHLINHLVFSALCLALCIVLPFLTGQIPEIGSMLCPMHIPVLLCGFACGWPWGAAVGAVAPLLRFLLFSMPPLMTAIPMAAELAVYGIICGVLYKLLPKKIGYIYLDLIAAMITGRLVWGAVCFAMAGFDSTAFSFSAFWTGAVVNALPGIILQIALIPAVVIALQKSKIIKL